MVTSILPMAPIAAATTAAKEPIDAAIFFSDLHTNKSDYKESTVKGIMSALKNTNLPFSSVTSCGDAFSVNEDNGQYTGETSTITGFIQTALGNNSIPVNYVWSDHDRYATGIEKKSGLVYGAGKDGEYGTADDGNYYVYALSMGDLCSYDRYKAGFNYSETINSGRVNAGFTPTVAKAIENFEADAAKLKKDRPLFIVSHQPLYDNRNDNAWAKDWFDSINAVAEDMDVAFFHGHNHNYDKDNEYYFAKGAQLPVATANGWGWNYEVGKGYKPSMDLSSESQTLNFTHMCTGYMAPSSTGSTSSTTREGVAVAVSIYEDSIRYVTYNNKGVYTGKYALDVTVDRDHKGADVEEPEVPVVPDGVLDEESGVSISAPGITKLNVTVTPKTVQGYTAYLTYDINPVGYNPGDVATVSVPVTGDFDPSKPVVVLDQGKVIATTNIVNGMVTFTTKHFSEYDVAQVDEVSADSKWVVVGTQTGGHKYVLDTNGMDSGSNNKYLVVGAEESIALTVSENSENTVRHANITISGDDKTVTMATRDPTYEFYFNDSGIKEDNESTYLLTKNGSSTVYHMGGNMHYGINDNGHWHVKHVLNGLYQVCDYDINGKWYLNYGIVWGKDPTNNFAVSSTGTNYVRLYKYDSAVPGGNIYAAIEGNTAYRVKQGTSEAKALEAVQTGITGYTSLAANGASADPIEDNDLTWTWKTGYNSSTPGTYVVEISYNNVVLGEVKVEVYETGNYPEYPDEGAVKVNKTGKGVAFQSSGIAQVEVSASGVPVKKGADLIIMLDTSSSMTKNKITTDDGTEKARSVVLEAALKKLIAQLKATGEDGEPQDIRVAIADFNGYFGENAGTEKNTPYDAYDSKDAVKNNNSNGKGYNQESKAKVYTGKNKLNAEAFVAAKDLDDSYALTYTSGTNYDYAFDAIAQMATSIQDKNAKDGEERDLFVIFMSDGAALQWNYFRSQNDYKRWNSWLTGAWGTKELTTANLNSEDHSYYYDLNDHDKDGQINEHRMASAIKGSPDDTFEVIRKNYKQNNPRDSLDKRLKPVTGKDNLFTMNGLGATVFTINFDAKKDGEITADNIDKALASTASDKTGTTQYYYKITSETQLKDAFKAIGDEVTYAATNARFVDQMGEDYDLKLGDLKDLYDNPLVVDGKDVENKIEIISYEIYTRQDYLDKKCTEDQIGSRTGNSTILETVTFNADGTEAYSDQIKDSKGGKVNILKDDVICAQSFWYNTKSEPVEIPGIRIPTSTGVTEMLPKETFYWNMGTVKTTELAMRYYVYLTGSMDGECEAGAYPTNEYATLYYDNYLGHPCYKETVSPVMPWEEARVSYAFYLVDEDGNIIVNQTSGMTGGFANKIAITVPVEYAKVNLNSEKEVESVDVVANAVLPDYYELYDPEAAYTVEIKSDGTGSWEIVKGTDKVASTYVTDYSVTQPHSNALKENGAGNDYTHTTVWFAVKWSVQAHPDTVVVDYGLPVDINVLNNDMFAEPGKAKLVGIRAYENDTLLNSHDAAVAAEFATNYSSKYGSAVAHPATGIVTYSPGVVPDGSDPTNMQMNMQMDGYDRFYYAAEYLGTHYFDTVTVVPATTIYYEDSFVSFEEGKVKDGPDTKWMTVKDDPAQTDSVVTQAQDRPGEFSLKEIDVGNLYGYDGAYSHCSKYSLGSAQKVTVSAANNPKNGGNWPTATFTFTGTGFDIISLTDSTTGFIVVKVYKVDEATGKPEFMEDWVVHTYYGYTYVTGENGKGEWVVTDSADPNALYQIPVIKSGDELDYGTYMIEIVPSYHSSFDPVPESMDYDFYLDAIRIYEPAGDGDEIIQNAYKADGEAWPVFMELRNMLIEAAELKNSDTVNGVVFIDGKDQVVELKDYVHYGPNNEVYLSSGQAISFNLDDTMLDEDGVVADVQIAMKSADGKPVKAEWYNITESKEGDLVPANVKSEYIETCTDMYYSFKDLKDDVIVIENTGNAGILSITNVKVTYKEDPDKEDPDKDEDDSEEASLIWNNQETANRTLAFFNLRNAPGEEAPSVFVPETFDIAVDKQTVKQGQTVKVTVKASSDVAKVVINGVEAKKSGANWTATVKADEAGMLVIAAVAYDSDGVMSDPIGTVVTVTEKSTGGASSGGISGGASNSGTTVDGWDNIWNVIMKKFALLMLNLGGIIENEEAVQ